MDVGVFWGGGLAKKFWGSQDFCSKEGCLAETVVPHQKYGD